MGRLHGRRGRLYVGLASDAAAAEPVAYLNSWSIEFSVDNEEVTAFEDLNKVYLAGLPDASGDIDGYYDDASAQLYTAATDGLARRFYLYPSTQNSGQYFFGTGLFDFSINTSVDGAVEVSSSWQAASTVQKVG
ncbi:MAG: phage tail protein [Actinomycetota bacterium]|nr:phage tail protein [Actinomycetota bacterium]